MTKNLLHVVIYKVNCSQMSAFQLVRCMYVNSLPHVQVFTSKYMSRNQNCILKRQLLWQIGRNQKSKSSNSLFKSWLFGAKTVGVCGEAVVGVL